MSTPRADIPVLNGVRGLAVLVVFLSHASNIYFGGAITGWGGGQLGVMLFFVLSGFLMAHLYMGRTASAGEVRRFAVNRLARIYPMFAIVVLCCYAVFHLHLPLYAYPIRNLREVLLHLGFVHGYEVLWTIGPEVIFYGLFVMAWWLRGRSEAAMWAFLSALLALAWIPLQGITGNSLLQLHDKLPYFLAGTLMGMRSGDLLAAAEQRSRWAQWGFWAALAIFVLGFPRLLAHVGPVPHHLAGDPWPHPWGYPFYLFATVGLFVSAVLARPRLLTHPLAQFAGRISYSFYLLHFMVLKNLQPLLPTHPLRAIGLAGVITVGLSWLCFRLVETPARRALRRFGAATPTPSAPRPPDVLPT